MSPAAFPYWRLSAYYFFYFGCAGVLATYLSLYLQSLAFSATEIAVLMSLMQVMRLLAPNLWGWLAERLGMRIPIIRLSALASLAGFSLFFVTTRFEGLFIAMALMAFFWSAALPLVESVTFNHLGTQVHRYGRIRLWGSIGFIVTVLGIGHALDFMPMDALLWMTVVVLLGIIVCAFTLPDAGRPEPQQAVGGLWSTIAQPRVRALLGACFFMSAAHGALYFFFPIYLVSHGYGKSMVGWMWTLGVLAEIAVFLLMPRLSRRWSLRTLLIMAFVAASVRFVAIGWGVDSLAILAAAQILHGLTFGAYHAAAIALINQWFEGRLQSRGQALYGSISFGAGGMLGGLLSGLIWDVVGPAWTFTIASGFAFVGLLWLLHGWRNE